MDIDEMDIGDTVRLGEPYKGWGVGEIIDFDYPYVLVELTNGKEIQCWPDELKEFQ